MKKHKQWIWGLVAVLLALLSIAAMLSRSDSLTVSDLIAALGQAHKGWLILAFACVFGYIFFEGAALWYLLRKCGFKKKLWEGITYASADIYCASITPSASGGQPVCGWFMVRDGIPGGFMTAILMFFLVMHSIAALVVGILALMLDPAVFLGFSWLGKALIAFGYLCITGLSAFFIACLKLDRQIQNIGFRLIDWAKKKKLIRNSTYWKDKLAGVMADYRDCVVLMKGKGYVYVVVFLLNVVQRLSQTIVSSLIYMATGGTGTNFITVFVTQIFTTVGSMCLPVPGGMGVADYLLYNGLKAIMERESALQLELLARSFSFYLCILISMFIVIAGYIARRKMYFTVRRKRK